MMKTVSEWLWPIHLPTGIEQRPRVKLQAATVWSSRSLGKSVNRGIVEATEWKAWVAALNIHTLVTPRGIRCNRLAPWRGCEAQEIQPAMEWSRQQSGMHWSLHETYTDHKFIYNVGFNSTAFKQQWIKSSRSLPNSRSHRSLMQN